MGRGRNNGWREVVVASLSYAGACADVGRDKDERGRLFLELLSPLCCLCFCYCDNSVCFSVHAILHIWIYVYPYTLSIHSASPPLSSLLRIYVYPCTLSVPSASPPLSFSRLRLFTARAL